MPNWVATTLKVTGPEDDVLRFKSQAEVSDTGTAEIRLLSFDKFVPMPLSLNVEKGSQSRIANVVYGNSWEAEASWILRRVDIQKLELTTREQLQAHFDATEPDLRVLAETMASNVTLYGHADWYDWCIANWGVKWDASDVTRTGGNPRAPLKYRFETAWNAAEPIIQKMSEQFPSLTFACQFREEGGAFCYSVKFESGVRSRERDLVR